MSDAPLHYTKLPGPSVGWAGRTRLWLAEDHLLEVNSSIFTERYHRFFLHDIRSAIALRTKVGLYWNIALGSLAALSLAAAGGLYWASIKFPENGARNALWFFSGTFVVAVVVLLIALLINTLYGPTCRLQIQTTAGTRVLASPTRLRRADRLLEKIVPHIEAVQSTLPP